MRRLLPALALVALAACGGRTVNVTTTPEPSVTLATAPTTTLPTTTTTEYIDADSDLAFAVLKGIYEDHGKTLDRDAFEDMMVIACQVFYSADGDYFSVLAVVSQEANDEDEAELLGATFTAATYSNCPEHREGWESITD